MNQIYCPMKPYVVLLDNGHSVFEVNKMLHIAVLIKTLASLLSVLLFLKLTFSPWVSFAVQTSHSLISESTVNAVEI